ncbi:hypothetical protein DAKH74_037950 [Maudiozyma humilis]|uniref:C2H2-type domain-containing protein n=1 Tax=Maudiozyma humilis TaxID=51915 RepID=A0AAV5RZY1_MAUHU|nr:hypothetical protein DAKH74_037950 [Kazachstania humilis]
MKDNQEISLLPIDGSLETSLVEVIDFVLASKSITEVFSSDNDNTSTLPKEFQDLLNSGFEDVFAEGLSATTNKCLAAAPSIHCESFPMRPVGADNDGYMQTRLKQEWEQADRLRQQVNQNPGDKEILEEFYKECLKWSQRNRDMGSIPQVELKPKGGKVGKNEKPPMPKTLKCPFCKTWTQNSSALKRHLNLEIKDFKPFECEVCSASFCRRDALKQHCQVHRNRT